MNGPMNRKGMPAMRKDPFAKTVLALLRPRAERGGWVRVEDLAREVGVSKSTVRRQLDALEAAGFPVEHHVDSGAPRRLALGVRSLLVSSRRDPDPDPARWVDRDSLRRPASGRTGAHHPWRKAA
ncbi:MAG TPA: helix-turn-helix domain-containing protein [Thermomonas sp.]